MNSKVLELVKAHNGISYGRICDELGLSPTQAYPVIKSACNCGGIHHEEMPDGSSWFFPVTSPVTPSPIFENIKDLGTFTIKVFEEVALLEEEFAGNAPVNVLLCNMADKYKLNQQKVELIMNNLEKMGKIYFPNPNKDCLRRV